MDDCDKLSSSKLERELEGEEQIGMSSFTRLEVGERGETVKEGLPM